MKSRYFQLVLVSGSLIFMVLSAYAQLDSASSLLLRSSRSDAQTSDLDSSRYTVRPSTQQKPRILAPQKQIEEKNKPLPEKKTDTMDTTTQEKANSSKSEIKNISDVNFDNKIESENKIDEAAEYTEKIHPYDSRQNLVNISIAPAVIYIDSQSDFWYRRFHSSGPGVSLNADIWLSQRTGFNLDYITSLSAELDADPASTRNVLVDHRYVSLGFLFRRFSSLSRKANSLNLSLQYTEYKMIVPKTEANRSSLTISGLSLGIGLRSPSSVTTAWTIGTELLPKLKVKEVNGAGSIVTGSEPTGYGIKMYVGQEYAVDRRHQVFWRLSHRFDKTVYESDASPVDPISSSSLSGVEVKTGASMFELGYTWGG